MSSSRTAKLFGIARGCKGGATVFDKSPSDYNAKMKYLSASIFGEYKKPMDSHLNKKLHYSLIAKPLYERPEIVRYYPAHEEIDELFTELRNYGLFRDEHKDFVEEMERMRKLRGKSKFDWGKKWMKKGKHY